MNSTQARRNDGEGMSALRATAVRAIGWSAVQSWGSSVIGFVVFLALARLLEPAAFGLMAFGWMFIALAEILVDQGFGGAIVQRDDIDEGHLNAAFWTTCTAGVVVSAAGVLLSNVLAATVGEPSSAPVFACLSLQFLLVGLASTQQAILQRRLAFRQIALRSLVATTVGGGIGIALALLGYGIWSLVAQSLASAATSVAVLWTVTSWRPSRSFSRRHLKDLLGFSASTWGISALSFVNRYVDHILIGWALGPVWLGYYAIGCRLIRLCVAQLAHIATRVMFPLLARLQAQPERVRGAFAEMTRYTALVASPVFAGLAATAPEFVNALYGPKWLPAAPVLQALAVLGWVQSISFFNGSVLLARGRATSLLMVVAIYAGLSTLICLAALSAGAGIAGVAWSIVACGCICWPMTLLLVCRDMQLSLRAYVSQLRVPVTASLVMAAAILVAQRSVLSSISDVRWLCAAEAAVAATVYLGVLAFSGHADFLQGRLQPAVSTDAG